jgi:hypothetical protein
MSYSYLVVETTLDYNEIMLISLAAVADGSNKLSLISFRMSWAKNRRNTVSKGQFLVSTEIVAKTARNSGIESIYHVRQCFLALYTRERPLFIVALGLSMPR